MMLLRPRHQAASSSGYKGWKQDGAITRTTEEDNDRRMQPGWTTPGFHAHEAHADLQKRRELAEDLDTIGLPITLQITARVTGLASLARTLRSH